MQREPNSYIWTLLSFDFVRVTLYTIVVICMGNCEIDDVECDGSLITIKWTHFSYLQAQMWWGWRGEEGRRRGRQKCFDFCTIHSPSLTE